MHVIGLAVILIALVAAWFAGGGVARFAHPALRWPVLIGILLFPVSALGLFAVAFARGPDVSWTNVFMNAAIPTLIWSAACFGGYYRARQRAAP